MDTNVEPPIRNCTKCGSEIVLSTCNEWELTSASDRSQYWFGLFTCVVYAPPLVFALTGATASGIYKLVTGCDLEKALLPGAIAGAVCVVLWWPFITWRYLRPIRASKKRMQDPVYRERVLSLSSGSVTPVKLTSPTEDSKPNGNSSIAPVQFSESQKRVRLGMLLVFWSILTFAVLAITIPATDFLALPEFMYRFFALLRSAANFAILGGCFFCLQESRFVWSKRYLIISLLCFGLPLLVSPGLGFGLRLLGFGSWMFYLLSEDRGESFGWFDTERGYMIPAAVFIFGVIFTVAFFTVDRIDSRTNLILLVPYAFAALMTWGRIPGIDNSFANQ